MFGRRLLVLLVILGALAIPAGALRATCAGRSCSGGSDAPARIPFCSLPSAIKADLVAGFRQGRSPDILAVAAHALSGGTGQTGAQAPWPALTPGPDTSVPLVFAGRGVDPAARVPRGTGLDQVAPTVARILGFRRPHPEIPAGTAVPGVPDGTRPRLVLEIAWKGAGGAELRRAPQAWPTLASLLRRGTGTLSGTTGSLPLDPTATLTTIGTGGPPSQHGITGTLLRNRDGHLVHAWGPGSPPSVIPTLADDVGRASDRAAMIGLVAATRSDRGIVGGTWYRGQDRDPVRLALGGAPVSRTRRLLATGFGRDGVPDILAVVLDGSIRSMDRRTRRVIAAARQAAARSLLVVVAGTGSSAADRGIGADEVAARVEAGVPGGVDVIAGTVAGGIFLDQDALATLRITGQTVTKAVLDARAPDGSPLFADAFQGFAVSFARYC
ncbi:MAG TPA: hypothetical protein VE646_06155 [Actinomycetota bacterium]|nr:hypothetical protein [Actinomycetota bacterium]